MMGNETFVKEGWREMKGRDGGRGGMEEGEEGR